MESAQRDPRVGVVLNGRYRITELLGEGGMGLVYRGERIQLGRPVAIKFLHLNYAKSPKFVARFEREAKAMSKLSHPYCVSVIDFGVHDEPYIVMDFVTGTTLRELMDKQRLTPQRAVQITRQILGGLAHAHEQGVIHRDVKPGNVMVGEAVGMGDHVRIFDFGLAKLHDATVEGDHSAATVIGTPSYMAPEQTRAEPIDARADLYAAGILLFEMLTGEKPFTGEDAYAVIRKQREEPPPAVTSLAPLVSGELEQVVQRALQKDREHRYQSAGEFAAALELVPEAFTRPSAVSTETPKVSSVSADGEARKESTPTDLRPESGSRAQLRAVLGLVLVGLVGLFVYLTTRQSGRDVHEAQQASGSRASEPPPEVTREASTTTEPTIVGAPALDAALDDVELQADAQVAAEAGDGLSAADGPLPDEGLLPGLLDAATFAEAQRALDQTEDKEAAAIAATGPEVKSISDVHRLIDRRQFDAAIYGLRALRKKSPYNPYYPYLLGDLYFERGFWGDGLAKYREAIRLNDGYKKRATIHQNAIRALGRDDTYARALVLLERDVGEAARPALELATKSTDAAISDRAKRLLELRAPSSR